MKRSQILLLLFVLIAFGLSIFLISRGVNFSAGVAQKDLTPAPSVSTQVQIPQVQINQASDVGEFKENGVVSRVVDGDTIEVNINGVLKKLRYIGVNTPETVDPRRGVQCFGKKASDENKKLVEGKTVYLSKDVSETDKYGRLLRYVYLKLEDGRILFVNDYLVREGYAYASSYPPDVKYVEQFKEAQKQAMEQNKGLWGECGGKK